jgi:aspartate kinase
MVEIVKTGQPEHRFPVLSAFKGVTDLLLSQAKAAKNGSFDINELESKHHYLVNDLQSRSRAQLEAQVGDLIKELRANLIRIRDLRDLTPMLLDQILAYGEKLAVHVSAGYFAEENISAIPLSGIEAGILANSNFGNATILERSRDLVRSKLAAIRLPLVAGFFGQDDAGRIATLGRGATDYVAAFIAAAFNCRTTLFKDVDGIMTADPKIVPEATLIPNLNYRTAIDLAHYGSKVLFEKAVAEAMKAQIPLEVKNFNKSDNGTSISGEGAAQAISYLKEICIVEVDTTRPNDLEGLTPKETNAGQIDGPILAASTSSDGVWFVAYAEKAVEAADMVQRAVEPINVNIRGRLSLIALTGKEHQAKVYESLRRQGIDPIRIFEAPSRITTCCIVDQSDLQKAVKCLHDLLRTVNS